MVEGEPQWRMLRLLEPVPKKMLTAEAAGWGRAAEDSDDSRVDSNYAGPRQR